MALRRIALLQFDRDPLVCRSRVRTLKRQNPDVHVVGLYGGEGAFRRAAFWSGAKPLLGLDSLYISRKPGRWNWLNGDLTAAKWFREVGHTLDFDVAHIIQWDLLFAAPLEDVYGHHPADAVALTALTPLTELKYNWEWLQGPDRQAWEQLLRHVEDAYEYDGVPHACLGPGIAVPRAFLKRYAEADVPEVCHDELRLPLFAQAFGFNLVDTGFRSWFDPAADPYFNVGGPDIRPESIRKELAQPGGRRAFHPVRYAIDPLRN